ncbi:MAG: hypothetical protein J6T57_01705 [Alphaproteobacteria bacterium]|nr:hypothetical protein [Alphaproteobacteria bacterium]
MKKIIFAICMLCTGVAFAANEESVTSREYVDAGLSTKQDTLTTTGTGAMTFDSSESDGLGQKPIYNPNGDYATQQNALVTASTANAGVQNAVATEFECIKWDPNDRTVCWLVQIVSKQLPAAYTQLEYLESTGTQYIDTGIPATQNTGVSVKYAFTALTRQTYIFGSYSPHYYLGINSAGANMIGSYGPSGGNTVGGIPISDVVIGQPYVYNLNYNNSGVSEFVDIQTRQLPQITFSAAANNPIKLFCGDTNTRISHSRIYYMKITNGSSLVRNFIPARRNSDGVLGMYDTISRTFFTNDGTGNFIAGPDKNVYLPSGQ